MLFVLSSLANPIRNFIDHYNIVFENTESGKVTVTPSLRGGRSVRREHILPDPKCAYFSLFSEGGS